MSSLETIDHEPNVLKIKIKIVITKKSKYNIHQILIKKLDRKFSHENDYIKINTVEEMMILIIVDVKCNHVENKKNWYISFFLLSTNKKLKF